MGLMVRRLGDDQLAKSIRADCQDFNFCFPLAVAIALHASEVCGKAQTRKARSLCRSRGCPWAKLTADYYYDPANYLLLQVDTASEKSSMSYRVSRFHDIDGPKVPREWSFGENRTVADSIKINTDIDDKQFAKPK